MLVWSRSVCFSSARYVPADDVAVLDVEPDHDDRRAAVVGDHTLGVLVEGEVAAPTPIDRISRSTPASIAFRVAGVSNARPRPARRRPAGLLSAGLRKGAAQRVERRLGLGARQRELLVELTPDHAGEPAEHDQRDQPGRPGRRRAGGTADAAERRTRTRTRRDFLSQKLAVCVRDTVLDTVLYSKQLCIAGSAVEPRVTDVLTPATSG